MSRYESPFRLSAPQKLGLLGSLYFAQGLPFGFFTQALPAMLRKQGFSLPEIGLSSLLALPWALKFLWAPAVDRYSSPAFGHRKSWIIPLQILSTVTLLVLAREASGRTMTALMVAAFLLNLFSATQDIATDGLAVDMLEERERGVANGLQVAGYRVGMIVGGGVLLVLHERLGFGGTFAAMAALMVLSSVPIAVTREPRRVAAPRAASAGGGASHFLRRPGVWRVVALIVTYKLGDAFATGMLRPFLADEGLTLADIVAGLAGAMCGGALVNRLGRRTSLLGFGLLQAATVAGYACLALTHPGHLWLGILCGVEHFAGGLATAALFTCMMDWCSPETSATDYTVQASAVVIATGAASALSGFSAAALGYFGHFSVAALGALASLVAVARFFPAGQPEPAAKEAVPCA